MIQIYLADDDPADCELFVEATNEISIPTKLHVFNTGEQLLHFLERTNRMLYSLI